MIIEDPIAAAELEGSLIGVSRGTNGADGTAFCFGGSPCVGRLACAGGATSSRLLNMTSPVAVFLWKINNGSFGANPDELLFLASFAQCGRRCVSKFYNVCA